MNRLLASTAVGLLLSMSPAFAQEAAPPADEAQTPPAAAEETLPSDIAPPEIMQEEPAEPAEPVPDKSSEIVPEDDAMPALPKASELDEPIDDPDAAIEDAASLDQPMFADQQETDQWLASTLIGQTVVNADNDHVGEITDIVTDERGEVVAVLVGVGGFLGLGQKDVAMRYGDLSFNRDEAQNVTVVTPLTSEMLASAPEYKRLNEQALTVGENTTVIEKDMDELPSEPGIN